MSAVHAGRRLNTPDARFLALSVLVVIIAIGLALIFVDARVETNLDHEEERAARRELALLQDIYADDGSQGVREAITRRGRASDQETIFALRGADGSIAGGGVSAWPDVQWDDGAWGQLDLARAGDAPRPAGALISLLPDGTVVLIGNDLSGRARVRNAALAGFALALVSVTALAFAAGVQMSARARHRVAAITGTAEEVMEGRLHARVPVADGDSGDVFAHLSVVVNTMLDRLEALFGAMQAVTDSLAHDLRTPLNRLKASLERAAAASKDDALDEIEAAQGEADRLASTFAALIDIARAESGLSADAMEMVDLRAMIEGLADLFGPSAEDRGQRLTISAPPLMLRAHRPLLSQAIGNLIDNAIKHAPTGGTIALSSCETADGVEIVVADDGGGIPEMERLRAVQRFVRLENAGGGTGLGLSIAAATARLHKGELSLQDNAPGLRAVLSLRTKS